MTAKITNPMSIIYGGTTFGATSDYLIDGPITIRSDNESVTVTWRTVIKKTTTANLKTATDAIEAEMRQRFQRLRVIVSSQTFIDLNPADNSGFNQEPSATKVGEDLDTGITRTYQCSVTAGKMADDNTSRRWSSVELTTSANDQRVITVSGQYTAGAAATARANYEALIDAYTASIKSAIGGTYDKTNERATTDDQNKLCDFTQTFTEIIYDQSSAGADHASIKNHRVRYIREAPGPGDTPLGGSVRRLQNVTAVYSCEVDESQTTDLNSLWENTIRPYILAEAERLFSPGQTTIIKENPDLGAAENVLSGSLLMQMSIGSNTLIEYVASQSLSGTGGKILTAVWDGNPYSRHVYQGPRDLIRTTTVRKRVLELAPLASVAILGKVSDASGPTSLAPFTGGDWSRSAGWIVLSHSRVPTPRKLGVPALGREMDATDWELTVVEQYVTAPAGRSGGTIDKPHPVYTQ